MENKMPQTKKTKRADYTTAIGRRKTAIAQVKLVKGTGKIILNGKETATPSRVYTAPLKLTGFDKKVDVFAKVSGGGIVAQEEAVRLGIARALDKMEPDLHKTLKVEGFLTRDPRMKER